jgi:predicted secreted protein
MGANNTTSVLFGNKLILMVKDGTDYKPIAHATSHSIEVTRETRSIASKSVGDWNLAEHGKASWSGSADALYSVDAGIVSYDTLLDMQIDQTRLHVISVPLSDSPLADNVSGITDNDLAPSDGAPGAFAEGSHYRVGEAIITNVSVNADQGDNASFSISFEGATPLTKKTVTQESLWTVTITANDGAATDADFAVINGVYLTLNQGVGTINLADGTYGVTAGKNDGSLSGDNTVIVAGADVGVTVTIA